MALYYKIKSSNLTNEDAQWIQIVGQYVEMGITDITYIGYPSLNTSQDFEGVVRTLSTMDEEFCQMYFPLFVVETIDIVTFSNLVTIYMLSPTFNSNSNNE